MALVPQGNASRPAVVSAAGRGMQGVRSANTGRSGHGARRELRHDRLVVYHKRAGCGQPAVEIAGCGQPAAKIAGCAKVR